MNLKCPACDHPLTEKRVGQLCAQACQGGCGGIWFDTIELQQVHKESESAGESLLQIQRDRHARVDPSRPRLCPRCAGVQLKRVLFGAGSRAQVDECPNCGGCWLDDGVLAQLQDEQQLAGGADQAGGADGSFDLAQYLYQMRTGHRNK